MKTRKILTITSAVAAAVLLGGALPVSAYTTVGVNFVNDSAHGIVNTASNSLAPTDMAGASSFAQANWNNLGPIGDSVADGVTLTNNVGSATALTISWVAGSTNSFGTNISTPDYKLMNGAIGGTGSITNYTDLAAYTSVSSMPAGAQPMVYLGGLNAWFLAQGATGYSIVIYQNDNAYYGLDLMWVESVSGSPFNNTMVAGPDLTPQLWTARSSAFSGSYSQIPATATSSGTAAYGANYGVFTGLTNDAVLIRAGTGNYQAGSINGFQIIPVFPPPFLSATNSTTTNSVAINFVNVDGPGMANGQAASLLPSEKAGAPGYAQTNWNNLARQGTALDGSVSLTNSLGVMTPLFINWDAAGRGTSGTNLTTSDFKLMNGFLAIGYANRTTGTVSTNVYGSPATAKPLVYVSGLQAWYQAQGAEGFGVAVYENDGGSYDTSLAWVQSVTGSPTNGTMVAGPDLTPRLHNGHSALYAGTYIQVPNTATNDATKSYGANYCTFLGITNDSVLIRSGETNEDWGAGPMNGFQIVPIFPTMPTAGTPTFSPSSTVYAGVPVTITEVATGDPVHPQIWYQWLKDTNSDNNVTNIIVGATNSTYSFTPLNAASTYTISFDVIATNIFGGATSSVVTLTVNPAVAPYVTTDTTPGPGDSSSAVYAYVNGGITFNAAFDGPQPISYQWNADTGTGYTNILNATNTTVTLTNLQLNSSGNYRLTANNQFGPTSSTPAPLTVLTDPAAPDASEPYAYEVFTNNPAAYWRFSETLDNSANSVQAYDYSGNNHNATYGHGAYDVTLGYNGPLPTGGYPAGNFPGFESTNGSVTLQNNIANSWLTSPALNLNTNTVTITAWINPSSAIGSSWGLFTWANTNGSDKASFGFGHIVNTNAGPSYNVAELGYVWNSNSPSTYNFDSGLYPPHDQWSFVALVITPTNTTIYLYYVDGSSVTHLSKAVQTINNSPEAFSGGTTWIGSDSYAGRNFNGSIDEMAVFNRSLSETQIQNLFLTGTGIAGVAPSITKDISPTSVNTFVGQPIQLTASGTGAPVPGYQWQRGSGGSFTNLSNVGGISGVNSGTLNIAAPTALGDGLNYRLVLTNSVGSVTSSVCSVTLTPVPTNGIWTANFQSTNNTSFGTAFGKGQFAGRGALGSGTVWNIMPDNLGTFTGGSYTNLTDYTDDGVTHSGVGCIISGGGLASSTTPAGPTSVQTLLDQWITAYSPPGALRFTGVPNGTYNLALYGAGANAGVNNSAGTTFVVHGDNGTVSNSTQNVQDNYLTAGDNTVIFTNIVVSGGTLTVDVNVNPFVVNNVTNTSAVFNGAQIQLVSYTPVTAGFSGSPTNIFVTQSVTFTDASTGGTNWFWNFGDGNTLNTQTKGATHAYASAGTYTVIQTVTGISGTNSVTNMNYIVVSPKPAIASVKMSAGSFVLSGAGGISGQQYRILTSTNVALPLSSWTTANTSVFAADGSYSYTNSSPTNNASFFILVSP